jgi:hypothetical protein
MDSSSDRSGTGMDRRRRRAYGRNVSILMYRVTAWSKAVSGGYTYSKKQQDCERRRRSRRRRHGEGSAACRRCTVDGRTINNRDLDLLEEYTCLIMVIPIVVRISIEMSEKGNTSSKERFASCSHRFEEQNTTLKSMTLRYKKYPLHFDPHFFVASLCFICEQENKKNPDSVII